MSKPKVWLWREPDCRWKNNVLGHLKDAGSIETDTVILHCIDVKGFDESIPITKFILNLCESFNVFKNERTMFLNLKDLLQAIELCLGRSACKSVCSEIQISEEEIMQCLQTYTEQFQCKDVTSENILNLNKFIEENNSADLWLINNKLFEQTIHNSNYMDQLVHSNYLILGTLPLEIFQSIMRLLTFEERVLNIVVETPLNVSLQGSPSSTPTNAFSNIEVTSEIIEIKDISLVPESELKLGSATEEYIEDTILSFLSLLVNSRSELALSKAMISPIIDFSHKAFTELKHLSGEKEMPMCQTAISYVTKIKLGGKGYAPPPDCPMLPHFKKLELFVDTLNQMQTLIEEDLIPESAVKRLINILKKKLLKCGSDKLRISAIETVTENLKTIATKVLNLQLEQSTNTTPQVCQASLDFLQHFINYINCSSWIFNPREILSVRLLKRTPISLPPLLGYFRSPEEETSCDMKSVLNEDSTTSNMFAPPPLMSYFHHSESSSAVGTCVDSLTPSKLTFKGCVNIFDDNENAREHEVKSLKKIFKSNKACKRSILKEITNENPPEKIIKDTKKNYVKGDKIEKMTIKSLPKKGIKVKTKGSKKFKLIEGQGKITNFFIKK